MEPSVRSTSLDSNTFVLGLNLGNDIGCQQTLPTRFHFVLDNSGSMGSLTSTARDCFAELIASASAPCSLVVFDSRATEIGRNFSSIAQMRNARIPTQGATNITAGVSMSLDIILDIEKSVGEGQTHHVLILLSDGAHNNGQHPEAAAPGLGQQLKFTSPHIQLSVIVVGVSRSSNTNMGMIMKTNLETLPLPSLQPIYFTRTPNEMSEALIEMKEGLEYSVKGSSVRIQAIHEAIRKGNYNTIAEEVLCDEVKEGDKSAVGLWETMTSQMTTSVKQWVNGGDGNNDEVLTEGFLCQVGHPLKSSTDVWVNENEEVTLLYVGNGLPNGVLVTYKDGTTLELLFSCHQKIQRPQVVGKKSLINPVPDKEWTCNTCTFINKLACLSTATQQQLPPNCEVCGTPMPSNQEMMESSASVEGALLAGQALADQENVQNNLTKAKSQAVEIMPFDEELAAKALEGMLEKARISKVANTGGSGGGGGKKNKGNSKEQINMNLNSIQALKKLIDSFETQLKLKETMMRAGDTGFNFGKFNGYDRVRQHKQSSRTLHGLKELKNQLAAVEAFESQDSSSQAEFLNGSKSKYASKALSRNAKRGHGGGGVGDAVDPMSTLVEECKNMEVKMKQALRADMCKRVALATRETCQIEIEKKLTLMNLPRSTATPSVTTSTSGSKEGIKLIGNAENRKRLADIFMKYGSPPSNMEFKTLAKQLIGHLIEQGMTLKTIDTLLETYYEVDKPLHTELIRILDMTCMVDDCVDEYLATTKSVHDRSCGNKERSSYLSLLTQREQLQEWALSASECGHICTGGAYEALMFLGTLAYPIDVERRAATQLDPYAMTISRVRTSLIDTASLCCALKSNHELVPPEGGVALSDALVLVDPDCPQASKICVKSKLVGEIYTSVVLARDLNMYTGTTQRVALHAHAFASLSKPNNVVKVYSEKRKDLEAMLRRNFLGKAYECAECGFGPIDHTACSDLAAHHGETVGSAKIDNSCPKCQWFSEDIEDWPTWNGFVPEEMFEDKIGSLRPKEENKKNGEIPSRASIEVMLRILYSARTVMGYQTCQELIKKLADWEESITIADGVDHPYQLTLAIACLCDEEDMESIFTAPPLLMLLNEMCSRSARDALKMKFSAINKEVPASVADGGGIVGGGGESGEENLVGLSRKFVTKLLGITASSAPEAKGLEESEPPLMVVRESCCGDFNINHMHESLLDQFSEPPEYDEYGYEITSSNMNNQAAVTGVTTTEQGEGFDFETFVNNSTEPICSMLLFSIALRKVLKNRGGGWMRLEQDMETGSLCYQDVIDALSHKSSDNILSYGHTALFDALLTLKENINSQQEGGGGSGEGSTTGNVDLLQQRIIDSQKDELKGKKKMMLTMTAQAFLHYNSKLRRTCQHGGCLSEVLGDIRDGATLRNLAIDLRMFIYQQRVGEKMKEWKSVGSDIVVAKARAADIGQYMEMIVLHAHGLDKPTFWGLWHAARSDGAHGEKVKYFLSKANQQFALAHSF